MRRICQYGLLGFLLLLVSAPRSTAAPAASPINDVYVVLLVLDGCRADTLYDLLDRGDLPVLRRYFHDDGVRFSRALAVFPSATPPGYQAMMSGLYPGHAGIPYLKWFARDTGRTAHFLSLTGHQALNRSFHNWYRQHTPSATHPDSIFAALAGHPSAAIFTPFEQRATSYRPTLPLGALFAAVSSNPARVNTYAMRALTREFRKPLAGIPRFSVAALYATDLIGHHDGARHPHLRTALQQFDAELGAFLALLRQRGLFDKTYVVVTADHGMHDIARHFSLTRLLTTHGFIPVRTQHRYRDTNIFIGERGVASAILTVRHPAGWDRPIDLQTLRHYPVTRTRRMDLPRLLAATPDIALTLVRDDIPGQVLVLNAAGESLLRVHREDAHTTYSYVAGPADVLGLRRYPHLRALTRGTRQTASQWQHLLADTDTPNAVPLLAQIFDDGHAGDLAVVASPDVGFFRKKRATHGTHYREDLHVPLLIRGPGLRPAQRTHAQTVDLYPTILRWFGLDYAPHLIDGAPLF